MSYRQQFAASNRNTSLRAMMKLFCAAIFATTMWAQAQTFTVLHKFTGGLDGSYPYAGLTMDRDGNLYGTTAFGGYTGSQCGVIGGCGTVFKLSHGGSGWIFNSLYQFQDNPDGSGPAGRVVIGPDGNLYGTTFYGGQTDACGGNGEEGCGTVFKLSPPPSLCKGFRCSWLETQLYSFSGPDGGRPEGEIAFDTAGNLYGTTEAGVHGWGSVYQLAPAQGAWTHAILYGFDDGLDGAEPIGGVQLDRAGNLYGTTSVGGERQQARFSNWLLRFRVGLSTPFTTFNWTTAGTVPMPGVIIDQSGNLYGGTEDGDPDPVVFELSPSNGGWTYKTLSQILFTFNIGGVEGNLTMDASGNIYGTTYFGGAHGGGSVFKLTPSASGWTSTDLYSFGGGSDGKYPVSNVVIDAQGNLYGTASNGGSGACAHGCGVVWEITP